MLDADPKLNTTSQTMSAQQSHEGSLHDNEIREAPEFGEGKLVSEADALVRQSDPDAVKFIQERKDMMNQKDEKDEGNKVHLTPISPLAASSTVVNLLLATGPFSYPYSFVRLGPILSVIIMAITCVLAYISATFMVEAISMANSKDEKKRRGSIFEEECYKTP